MYFKYFEYEEEDIVKYKCIMLLFLIRKIFVFNYDWKVKDWIFIIDMFNFNEVWKEYYVLVR